MSVILDNLNKNKKKGITGNMMYIMYKIDWGDYSLHS